MRRFRCCCGQELFFENEQCLGCKRKVGFSALHMQMRALEPQPGETWTLCDAADRTAWQLCDNYQRYNACNWIFAVDAERTLCTSCALNKTIPDLSVEGNLALWARIEAAKRRLLYTLRAMGLIRGDEAQPTTSLRFDILAATPAQPVVTGHEDGLITLALAEADDAERARVRDSLGEPYRTLLGHLRHESGHYFWDTLVQNSPRHAGFKKLFGDETLDYAEALANHYQQGPPPDWETKFISAYAASHPYEDWAETWAHYLHIRDTLQTARAYGLGVAEALVDGGMQCSRDFASVVAEWVPFTLAVNALNRSMGQPDMYPFALPPASIAKLQFVHELVLEVGEDVAVGGAPTRNRAARSRR